MTALTSSGLICLSNIRRSAWTRKTRLAAIAEILRIYSKRIFEQWTSRPTTILAIAPIFKSADGKRRLAQTLDLMSASQTSRGDRSRSSVHGSREEQGELGVRGSGLGVRELENADSKFKNRISPESEVGKAGNGTRDSGFGVGESEIEDCRFEIQEHSKRRVYAAMGRGKLALPQFPA